MAGYVLSTYCLQIDKKNAGSILGRVDVNEFESYIHISMDNCTF